MGNKNDRWSALSMSERADLIKLYVSSGITSLDTIKKDYNSFAPGGPTREMAPSEAAALNKILNQSQYMLAVGDSPDDPAYLSTDVLEPAVVKAFNSTEDYNRYQGEKFGEYVSNEISEAGAKLAPVLVGTAVAPWAISGGIAAYSNPLIKTGLDIIGSIDGIRNAASNNGIRKTIRLAKEGDVWGTTKSAVGDILDITGGVGLADDIYRYSKGTSKRLAETVLRMGPLAQQTGPLKTQILNKKALNYIFNPYADPKLVYDLPYMYSGNAADVTGYVKGHEGDIIDKFLRKVPVSSNMSSSEVPEAMMDYIHKNYPGKKIEYIDLGEVISPTIIPEYTKGLKVGERMKAPGSHSKGYLVSADPALFGTKFENLLDPGGYNQYYRREGNDLISEGFDIWKFNPDDYMRRYELLKGSEEFKALPISKRVKQALTQKMLHKGLSFIDNQGIPLVHKWHTTFEDVYKNGGKLNIFETGGPKDSKHVEDVVRTTRGSTGKILTKDFPFVDFKGAGYLWDSWRVMKGSDKKVAPLDDNYTGTAMKGVGVQTDNGLGFVSQQDLSNVLGYTPKDFVDTYVYGVTPFEELGVFKKEDSPERHVVRSKIKKVEDSGKQVNTYQTQRDTLDTNTVAALDSLLNAGLVDLRSENTTYQESPFNIGDSGIIYDGNNSTIATAYLPNGMPVSKAIDVFDTDPKEWNYKVGSLAKTGLGFIHDNTNPFLMTTPWYYPIKSTDYLSRLYYLFGIDADREYNVRENKGDKNGVIWELSEALEWLDNHPDLTEMPVKTKKD